MQCCTVFANRQYRIVDYELMTYSLISEQQSNEFYKWIIADVHTYSGSYKDFKCRGTCNHCIYSSSGL